MCVPLLSLNDDYRVQNGNDYKNGTDDDKNRGQNREDSSDDYHPKVVDHINRHTPAVMCLLLQSHLYHIYYKNVF